MDFEYTLEQEAFRQEVRCWLEANMTPDLCGDDAMDERVAGDRETFERRVTWQKKLNAGGTSEIQHNIIGERVLGLPKG